VRWISGLVHSESYPVAAFNRGMLHMGRGEPARAADELARAVAESSGAYPEIYSNLGSALLELRRYGEARDCFRVALDGLPLYSPDRRQRLQELLERSERELGRSPPPGSPR
jgi:tetratricopeptide (TPR) repeat protein